jgi:hypothetical protein
MLGVFIAVALLLALAFSGRRVWLRRRLVRLMRALPGGKPESAVEIASFGDIDDCIRGRRCACGGRFEVLGEGSRLRERARLRVIRLECGTCERETLMYFDVTRLFH